MPRCSGSKPPHLQFDRHRTVRPTVEEQQVDREIPLAHLQWELRAGEVEVPPQLGEELAQLAQQSAVQIGFAVITRKTEELDHVRITENVQRRRMRLEHHGRHLGWVHHDTLEQGRLELPLQCPAAPSFLNRHAQVELALFRPLVLAKDDQIVGPRQLSRQCRDFLVMGIRFAELPHAEWISPRESTQNPLRAGDVRGELCHHAIAPFSDS